MGTPLDQSTFTHRRFSTPPHMTERKAASVAVSPVIPARIPSGATTEGLDLEDSSSRLEPSHRMGIAIPQSSPDHPRMGYGPCSSPLCMWLSSPPPAPKRGDVKRFGVMRPPPPPSMPFVVPDVDEETRLAESDDCDTDDTEETVQKLAGEPFVTLAPDENGSPVIGIRRCPPRPPPLSPKRKAQDVAPDGHYIDKEGNPGPKHPCWRAKNMESLVDADMSVSVMDTPAISSSDDLTVSMSGESSDSVTLAEFVKAAALTPASHVRDPWSINSQVQREIQAHF